ncbi:MAG: amidohydrolase family protein [Candidatus Ryanbacteria bacterium]|nr:amidohydrolase family protein [Candidatus Ryanbacteria bacterium]
MPSYSYILKGGTIVDGSGFPMARGDLGISGETIKAVGDVGRGSAARVIDASGKYVMPGMIDIANHSDTHWTLFNYPSQENLLRQGITTIVGGICGVSLAPLADSRAIRAIEKWADTSSANINWRSFEEYARELERHEIGVNAGSFIGYTTLRHNIAGDESRDLTHSELESMKLMLTRSLDEGALGLSINLSLPSRQEEIAALSKVVADAGKLVVMHLKNEGRKLLQAVIEAISIARLSGAAIHISHFKGIGKKAWQELPKAMSIIRKVGKEENISITMDFFPYLRTGSLLMSFLPEWILDGGIDEAKAIIADQSKRGHVLETLKGLTLHYDNIVIAEAKKDKHSIGKTLADIAASTGLQPEEAMVHMLAVNDFGVSVFSKTLRSRDVVQIAREPFAMLGSDGVGEPKGRRDLTHPRSYGTAPRFIVRFVKRSKIFTWEEAVKKMTSMPAERLGIDVNRGLLKKGHFADVVVVDPVSIRDRSTYKEPFVYPDGIEYVFVNGRLAVEKNNFTGALAGKVLRRA